MLATVAGVALLVGGFFIGRVSESESSDTSATTETTATQGDKNQPPLTRACSRDGGPDAEAVVKVFPPIIVTDGRYRGRAGGIARTRVSGVVRGISVRAIWSRSRRSPARAPSTAIGDDKLAALVSLPGPGLPGIKVLGASESGDTAAVNAAAAQLRALRPRWPGAERADQFDA